MFNAQPIHLSLSFEFLAYKLDTSVSERQSKPEQTANSGNIDGFIDEALISDLRFDSKKHAGKYFDDRINRPLQHELLKKDLNVDVKKQRERYMKDRMIVIQSSDDTLNKQLADEANKYFDERVIGSRQRNRLSTE